jgi:hypothetical protein
MCKHYTFKGQTLYIILPIMKKGLAMQETWYIAVRGYGCNLLTEWVESGVRLPAQLTGVTQWSRASQCNTT